MQRFDPDSAPYLHPDRVPPAGPRAELEMRLQKLGIVQAPDIEDTGQLTDHVAALEQASAARLVSARPPGALSPAGGAALPAVLPRSPPYVDPP
eukprot:1321616-Alexandrium_andersonii.AAC.1